MISTFQTFKSTAERVDSINNWVLSNFVILLFSSVLKILLDEPLVHRPYNLIFNQFYFTIEVGVHSFIA